jgi:predicted nucleic acid-binding Zn ribbon protein
VSFSIYVCECCFNPKRTARWYCLDDNAEVTICTKCAADLRTQFEKVELID